MLFYFYIPMVSAQNQSSLDVVSFLDNYEKVQRVSTKGEAS